MEWILESFHVGWEPQPLHDHDGAVIWHPSVIHDFSRLSDSGPTSVMVTTWWGLYPHSLHMKFVNDCFYVWSGRGNNSMWDQRYNPENPCWTMWWSCTHPTMPLVAIQNCHQHISPVGNYWLRKHTHHQWWRPSLPSSRPPQHYPISPGSNYCWIRSGA